MRRVAGIRPRGAAHRSIRPIERVPPLRGEIRRLTPPGLMPKASTMRIVVTGARGFVGSAVLRSLASERHDHDVVSLGGEGEARVDLGDLARLVELFRGAEAVIHAAGTSVMNTEENVLGWLEVAGTENVARAARRAGVRRLVVFSSTDATLGTESRSGWDESKGVARPATRFGRIARAKEEAAVGTGAREFEPVVLRAGFVYGPGDRSRAPRYIAEARAHGGIRVFGRGLSFLPTTYVENLAHAAKLAIRAERAAHGIYHIVDREISGQLPFFSRYSIALGIDAPRPSGSVWFARLRARFGAELDEDEVLRRAVASSLATRRAHAELGFEPPYSQEDGMLALGTWVRERGGAEALERDARPTPTEADIESIIRGAA